MLFRYYLLLGLFSIVLVWPIKFFISFYYQRKRILQMVKGGTFIEDYPFIGIGNRLLGKDSRGSFIFFLQKFQKCKIFNIVSQK